MSLQTWRDKYYPETALVASNKGNVHMLKHSIRKWWGLRKSALNSHGCYVENRYLHDNETYGKALVPITGDTCSLCVAYHTGFNCSGCPIKLSTKNCTEKYPDFFKTGSPYPMIRVLIAALRVEIKQNV